MIKTLKTKLVQIKQLINADTVIFLVTKNVYDLLYADLLGKYKIANDVLVEEYGKPYLPSPVGHQREFREKFKKCLEFAGYDLK